MIVHDVTNMSVNSRTSVSVSILPPELHTFVSPVGPEYNGLQGWDMGHSPVRPLPDNTSSRNDAQLSNFRSLYCYRHQPHGNKGINCQF